MTLRIGSLCSGAGGLDLAVEHVFGAKTVWHCETDPAASKVLAVRWPGVPNYGDITVINWATVEPIDILCGGYPCQPFSHAGQRKGTNDERHLWPYVWEAIRRLRPRITILENVAGHRSLGFDRVLGDLAESGLHVRWVSIRASDVGACHQRERVWIIAFDSDAATQRCGATGRDDGLRDARLGAVTGSIDLLPTPNAQDGNGGRYNSDGHQSTLPGTVRELLPTPRTSDTNGAGQHGDGGLDLRTAVVLLPTPTTQPQTGNGHARNLGAEVRQWGKYEPAIRRWESLTRPAPPPTEPNRNGKPRLNPAFSEWMMGWPAGWVTDLVGRNDALRIIGNGVVPQQAIAALQWLLSIKVAA